MTNLDKKDMTPAQLEGKGVEIVNNME